MGSVQKGSFDQDQDQTEAQMPKKTFWEAKLSTPNLTQPSRLLGQNRINFL
jgi:hypothetical protein